MKARVLAAAVLVLGAGAAQAVDLAPHRALYTLSLLTAKPNSGVVGASGSLGYELGEACDGWTNEQRYKITLDYEDQRPTEIGSSLVTFESKDGKTYRFNEKKTRDGHPEDEIHGNATLGAPGAGTGGKAVFDKPKAASFPLPAGALYPSAHTIRLIETGRSAIPFISAQVFDGSDLQGASLVAATIGKPLDAAATESESGLHSPLLRHQSWRVHAGFYDDPDKAKDLTQDYDLGMRLLDNGVATSLVMDYGDYVLKATLKRIEPLKRPAC